MTQLQREIQPGHSLYGIKKIKAVGERLDQDDVLFVLFGHPYYQLAVVHLTYTASQMSTQWPRTTFFLNTEDWMENCMKPDSEGYD